MSVLGGITPLHEALDYHLARHNLLTSNLAHVDTPQYKAQELYRADSFEGVLEVQMSATEPGHLGASNRPEGWRVDLDPYAPVGADGNSVSLDREAVKVASNNIRYDAVTTMIAGRLESLLWASRDAR